MGLFSAIRDRIHPEPQGTTHVLEWLPAWMVDGAAEGDWDLQAERGEPAGTYGVPHLPRDASEDTLARWVESQVGYPITLTAGQQHLSSVDVGWRHLDGHAETCPIFWVTPACR